MINPTDEALPREVPTLDAMPAQLKPFYPEKKIDGTGFRLRYAEADDQKTVMAYHADIAAGKITLLSDGETPAEYEKRIADDNAARDAFSATVNARWNEELDRRKAEDEARLKKMQDEIDMSYARWKRQ